MSAIAAMTTVRNDKIFLSKWLDYYGKQFGHENLFVILDGHDQEPPTNIGRANLIRLPHQPRPRVPAMRRRAGVMSDIARGLHRYFEIVIATDVDEFLIVDPAINTPLPDYLRMIKGRASVSGLGLDVGQHLRDEAPLDLTRPYLEQRRYAHLSSRYTKPATSFRPLRWGSGIHRVKGRNFHIDDNLYHFHFGLVDYRIATGKTMDADRLATGWGGHLERRERLFKIITEATPKDGDAYFPIARRAQSLWRPIYALNKPAMMHGNPVVTIPKRFQSLV